MERECNCSSLVENGLVHSKLPPLALAYVSSDLDSDRLGAVPLERREKLDPDLCRLLSTVLKFPLDRDLRDA